MDGEEHNMQINEMMNDIYLVCSIRGFRVDPIFMHDPIGFLSSRGSSSVKHQRFLHTNQLRGGAVEDLFVFAGGFPISGVRRPVSSHSGRIFPVSEAEEIPFLFSHLSFP